MARSDRPRRRSSVLLAAALIAALFVVLALGFAQRTTGAAHADALGMSAPGVSGRVSVVGGSAANALLAGSHPIAHRRVDLADLAFGVAAIAAAFFFIMQAKRGARRGPRFDAVFVLRRGPPIPSFAS